MKEKNLITRIKADKQQTAQKIYYCDFETVIKQDNDNINKHMITLWCIIDNEKIYHDIINIENNICLEETFLRNCFELTTDSCLFYFHNLSRFDGLFLINYITKKKNDYVLDIIVRDRVIYCIKILDKKNGRQITIKDSYLILPLSLREIGEIFCKKYKKKDFDHQKIILEDYKNEIFKKQILDYCKNDCNVLKEGFTEYISYIYSLFNINITKCFTIAGLSMKIYRSKYYKKEMIYTPNDNTDNFIRKSYKGGIVDVYKPSLKNGYHYDINSLYPYVMRKYDMPVGNGTFVNGNEIDLDNFFGFLEVKITYVPNMYIPVLPTMDEKKGLISPLGTFNDVYFSEELKLAKKQGYKFDIIKGTKFEKENLFRDFVDDLYSIRINDMTNKSLKTSIKLIMNSLYGRFGMKKSTDRTCIVNKEDYSKIAQTTEELKYSHEINDMYIVTYSTKINKHIDKNFRDKYFNRMISMNTTSAVQIASAITSYARIEMYYYKNKYSKNLYYSDTDSLFLNIPLDEEHISDKEMGKFKLEGEIIEALFICPKVYYVNYTNLSIVKKMKGLASKEITKQDFECMYKGISIDKKQESFFHRVWQKMQIVIYTVYKKISGNYMKRDKILNERGEWIDTKPIIK